MARSKTNKTNDQQFLRERAAIDEAVFELDDSVEVMSAAERAARRTMELRQRELADAERRRVAHIKGVEADEPKLAVPASEAVRIERAVTALRKGASLETCFDNKIADSDRQNYDLWNDAASATAEKKGRFHVTVDRAARIGLSKTRLNRKSVHAPATAGHDSAAAVEIAHAGLSYNPTTEDHDTLLAAAYDRVLHERERRAELYSRATSGRDAVHDVDGTVQAVPLTEMGKEVAAAAAPEKEDEEPVAPEFKLAPGERVTKRQRVRRQQMKRESEKRVVKAAVASKLRDLGRLSEVVDERKAEADRNAEVQRIRRRTRGGRARPGCETMPAQVPTYQLPEEMTGCLRSTPLEQGDLMAGQVRNAQRRNVIEYRCRKPAPPTARKRFVPARHRITAEELGVDARIVRAAAMEVHKAKSAAGRRRKGTGVRYKR